MATTIFYFTGTGNTLAIARDLAEELGDTKLVPIQKAIEEGIDVSAEKIGIVFPVYVGGMPLIVSKFLDKIRPAREQYVFAIANCASMAGGSLVRAAKKLKAAGAKLSAGFIVKMPGNYIPFYGAIPAAKQQYMFATARRRLGQIAQIVQAGQPHRIERNFFLINWFFSLIYSAFIKKVNGLDSAYYADGKCTRCGLCAKICPVKNIEMTENGPKWLHKCEQCMACLQWCPAESIQYKKVSIKRERYHHPEIKPADLID